MRINILALGTAVMLLSGSAYATQILNNPDFETGLISPWTIDTSVQTGSWTITSTGCHGGSFCVQDLGTLTTGNVGLEQTFGGVAASSVNNLSFWVNPSGNISVTLIYSGGNAFPAITITPGGGWQLVNLTSSVTSHGGTLTGIDVFGQSGTGSATELDDFSLLANVPEPGAFWLLAAGLGTLGLRARRKNVQ